MLSCFAAQEWGRLGSSVSSFDSVVEVNGIFRFFCVVFPVISLSISCLVGCGRLTRWWPAVTSVPAADPEQGRE